MTRIKKNENVTVANRNKRKGGNGNLDLKDVSQALHSKSNAEPNLIKTGQKLKREKRNGKVIHDKHMVTQIKNIKKRTRSISSNSLSRTPKRTLADRDFAEKKTSEDTRELVLPSDSNIVKGNV